MSVEGAEVAPPTNGHSALAGTFRITNLVPPSGVVELAGSSAAEPATQATTGFDGIVLIREGKRLIGAVLIAAPLAPVLGVILSVLSMAGMVTQSGSVAAGGLSLVGAAFANLAIGWVLLTGFALVFGLSTAKGALPGTYAELEQWRFQIDCWLKYLDHDRFRLPLTIDANVALDALRDLRRCIELKLQENGSNWLLGTGYVDVWRLVHQAQEQLVMLISDAALSIEVRAEIQRFTGSAMGGVDDALKQLGAAQALIDSADGKLPAGYQPPDNAPTTQLQARGVVKVMRAKADQYRDKARSGLARARSDVIRTLTMVTMFSYSLFWLIIEAVYGYQLSQVIQLDQYALAAVKVVEMSTGALTLFLWGALVGLFGQLWVKWNANPDCGEDDFGLGIARIIAEPVVAGVAGMCGVVVLTFGGTLLTNGTSGLTNNAAQIATDLQNAFVPGSYPASLLFAAIFALSPNLLIARLQQAGSTLQQNLSNSSAGDGGGMSSTPGK